MIAGVIAQGRAGTPRGILSMSSVYFDAEKILGALVSIGLDQLVFAGFVNDADTIFIGTVPRVLNPGVWADLETVSVPRIVRDQVLTPDLCMDVDSIGLPSIAIPGVIQISEVFVDSDVIFSPTVVAPGSLRPGLYIDLDAFYTPILPETLNPSLYTALDGFFDPLARIGLGPSVYVDVDVFYQPTVPLRASLVVDADAFFVPTRPVPATFDGPIVGAMAMSNGNLKATHTANDTVAGVRCSVLRTAGKYYFEVTITQSVGAYTAIGIGAVNFDYTGMSPGVYAGGSGAIGANGGSTPYSLGAFVNGDVIGVAVDLDAKKAWFRQNNGLWNGNLNANPLIGVNGVTVPGGSVAPFVRFATNSVAGDNLTGNFGQATFFAPRPDGYELWPAPTGTASLVTDVDVIFAPSTTGGNLTVAPSLVPSSDTFFVSVVTGGFTAVAAGLVTDVDALYASAVNNFVSLTAGLVVVDGDSFFVPALINIPVALPSVVIDVDVFYAPTITQAQAGFDGVLTLDGPIMPSAPQPTVIYLEG